MAHKFIRCVLEYVRRVMSPWKFNRNWIWREL